MRFHAVLFSVFNKIPVFPIFTTRKIRNFLIDISWNFGYELDVNNHDVPINLDLDICMRRFLLLSDLNKKQYFLQKLELINDKYIELYIQKSIVCFLEEIKKENFVKRISNNNNDWKLKIETTYNKILCYIRKMFNDENIKLSDVKNEKIQKIIVQMASYYLTNGSVNSVYNYGLMEKMFLQDFNYQKEWEWILQDNFNLSQYEYSNPGGLFNLKFIDQIDYSGAHRFGWQYVYDNIKYLHNENSPVLFDLYIDRTFHWNNDINEALGIIPYKQNWIGVVHHTFDTSFSDFNCVNLLNNKNFIDSLPLCKGIIVLSNYLKTQFEIEFKKLGINVPIYHCIHPTELNVASFDLHKFYKNMDKKLVHIGGWLRDTYSFFYITTPEITRIREPAYKNKVCKIRKVALLGKNMNNYYPLADTISTIEKSLHNLENNSFKSDLLTIFVL